MRWNLGLLAGPRITKLRHSLASQTGPKGLVDDSPPLPTRPRIERNDLLYAAMVDLFAASLLECEAALISQDRSYKD